MSESKVLALTEAVAAASATKQLNLMSLLGIVATVLNKVGIDQSAYEPVASTVESLFDRFVDPIDLPNIPNFIEKPLHAAARAQIRPMLKTLFDLIVNAS